MTTSTPNSPITIPSEIDDEVDGFFLPDGKIWTYPCLNTTCAEYGKAWRLRSNFLLHLQEEQAAHGALATTPAGRHELELASRYLADPHLPPRAAPRFRPREDPREHVWSYSLRMIRGGWLMERLYNGNGRYMPYKLFIRKVDLLGRLAT
ncbi:hypothetical protein DL98DRAFT_611779 [Cadophora sp. DSE1049]|nr:hypothetical protein DL98DRAFT_611779 [Cadophora sp. DSE1049]